jgi:NCAIR mutase (PurE)-related protein
VPSLEAILDKLASRKISKQEAARLIRREITIDGYEKVAEIAKIDTTRMHRVGIPEIVLAEGKNAQDLVAIVETQLKAEGRVVLTRVSEHQLRALNHFDPEWNDRARIAAIGKKPQFKPPYGLVSVVSAGTADIAVAEEARILAEELGCKTVVSYDVGVAGIHRLYPELSKLLDADVLIVLAGREGALPTIIAGLTDIPVIGVPVSTGYGFGGRGEAALLAMLQSCSVLAVVNVDAGFVAGAFAAKLVHVAICLVSSNFGYLRLGNRLMERDDGERAKHGRFEVTLRDCTDRVCVLGLYLHDNVFVGLNDLERTSLSIFFDQRFDEVFDVSVQARDRLKLADGQWPARDKEGRLDEVSVVHGSSRTPQGAKGSCT